MRVLVTGAQGFTGRYLCEELERRGHQVLEFSGDITDCDAVLANLKDLKPDGIVHLAAIAFVASGDFEAFYKVNQLGAFHLLEAASAVVPGARIVIASSANIYGNQAEGVLAESAPPNPVNHYAISKWAMEMGARQWSDRLAITLVRPFNYTGVGQDEQYLIPKIVAHFRRRESSIELGNLDVRRDFGDVRSVVQAYCDLLHSDAAIGETYNVSSGEIHSLQDVITMASAISGHALEVRVNPRFVRANDVRILAGDASKLRAVLPEWRQIALEETMRWMICN
jgi:nucleoside-diphosphate-sugar epimerase